MGAPPAVAALPLQRELRQTMANYHVGGLLNALDEVAKRRGQTRLPATARMAGWALQLLLDELGLVEPGEQVSGPAGRRLLAEVWRGAES